MGIHILNIGIDLEIFETIEKDRITLYQMIGKTKIRSSHSAAFLEVLINLKLIGIDKNDFLKISSSARRYLIKNSPESIIPYIKWKLHTMTFWEKSIDVLKGNMSTIYGESLYEYLKTKPDQYKLFHKALEVVERPYITKVPAMIEPFIPKNKKLTLLDIGCGSALPSILVMEKFKNINAFLVDLNLEAASENIIKYGLSHRAELVKKDFFSDQLPQADIVFFSFVLSDWDDREIHCILKKISSYLNNEGMLFLIDYLTRFPHDPLQSALLNFLLSVETKGAIKTIPQWDHLLGDFFENTRNIPISEDVCLIYAEKREEGGYEQ
ncbi:MAG: methyltransferase [Candidatus Aminicenantes bacterium]|nr:methyltransferase [Candidatus Aminicenantes bacterium]